MLKNFGPLAIWYFIEAFAHSLRVRCKLNLQFTCRCLYKKRNQYKYLSIIRIIIYVDLRITNYEFTNYFTLRELLVKVNLDLFT